MTKAVTVAEAISEFKDTNIELVVSKTITPREVKSKIEEIKHVIKLIEEYKKHKSCFNRVGFHSRIYDYRVGYANSSSIWIKINKDFDLDIGIGENWWRKYSKYRKTYNKTASLLRLLKSILKSRKRYYDMLNTKIVCC